MSIFRRVLPVRPLNRLAQPCSFRTYASNPKPKLAEEAVDFRPPWVYTGTQLMSYTVIPFVAIYAVFVYDFGEGEHVFMPPRRWLAQQKAAFFTLSPAEQRLLESEQSAEEELPEKTFKVKSNP